MADIFISYNHADRERLNPLIDLLKRQAWTVFWDQEIRPGSTFRKEIAKELAAAQCVVVAWSADSVQSDWVIAEAEEAKKRGVLVPVFLEEVAAPFEFRGLETSRLFATDGTLDTAEAATLLAAVGALIGMPPVSFPAQSREDFIRIALLGSTTHEIASSKEKTRAIRRFYKALLAAIERTPYGLTSCGAEPLRRAFFESYCEKLYLRPRGDMREIDRRMR